MPLDPSQPLPGQPFPAPQPFPPLAGGAGPTADWLQEQLFQRRTVVLRGPLDDASAGLLAAQLMTLDATGDRPVALHVDSPGGPVPAAFTVIDTIDLLGVDVEVLCLGRVEGTAVGIVAVGSRRVATPNTRFRLSLPVEQATGRAEELQSFAEQHRRDVDRYVGRLAAACRRPVEHLEADLDVGRYLSADEALAFGIIDEVRGAGPRGGSSTGFRFGFQPPGR